MPHLQDSNAVILFVKNPEPGKVKTRLARTVGPRVAAQIYRHLSLMTFLKLQQTRLNPVIAYHPPKAKEAIQQIFDKARAYRAQTSGDLGSKMGSIFKTAAHRYQKIVLAGTDCSDLNPEDFQNAFQLLDSNSVVIGPASDGGYYLIGMQQSVIFEKNLHKKLFEGIHWSTSRVYRQTVSRLQSLQISFASLKVKSDLDEARDLTQNSLKHLFGV